MQYIQDLERRHDDLKSMVRELKAKLVTCDIEGKETQCQGTTQAIMLSETVLSYTKKYLFPQFKFLGKDWTEYDTNSGSFCNMVRQKLVLPRAKRTTVA